MNVKNDSLNLTFVFTAIILALLWKKSTSFCMFNFARDTNVALVVWPAPEHLKFEFNKNVYLECRLKGSANLGSEFKWISPTGTEVHSYRQKNESVFTEPLQHGGLSLYIINTNNTHVGQWRCSAMYGDVIRLTATFTLEFGHELKFIDTPTVQVLNSFEDSKIACSSQGHPVPEVEWRKHGKVITTGGRYEVVKDGLKIHEVTQEDEDFYECRIYVREQGTVDIRTLEVKVETPVNDAQSSENIVDQTSEQNSTYDSSSEVILKNTFCDFESVNLCGFTQDSNDDFDWTRLYGETPTMHTGPAADHTYGTKLGHYMYIESSWPQHNKDKARLISPPLIGDPMYCISFWYHMYGQDMGYLNVFKNSSTTPEFLLWSTAGNRGKQWNRIHITVQAEKEEMIWIIFEGVNGESFTSDIAIDDILMTNKPCNI